MSPRLCDLSSMLVLVSLFAACGHTRGHIAPAEPAASEHRIGASEPPPPDGVEQPPKSQEFDPSDPTNLYTLLDVALQWEHFKNGENLGLLVSPTFAFDTYNQLQVEIPMFYADFDLVDSGYSLGDIRLRYFGLPYKDLDPDPGVQLTAAGLTMDVFLPTGDDVIGAGSGNWVFVPGVTFGIQVSDSLNLFPILSYKYVLGDSILAAGGANGVVPIPGTESSGSSHGFSAELICSLDLTDRTYLQVIPLYSRIFSGNNSTAFNIRLNFGYMVTDRLAVEADFLHEFVDREDMMNRVRIGVQIFF